MNENGFYLCFLILFIGLGFLILVSYAWFGWYYFARCSTREQLWAFWSTRDLFVFWCVSATMSTIGFLCFSYRISHDYTVFAGLNDALLLVSYGMFLLASLCYAPLMMWNVGDKKKNLVIIDLFVVAISALILFVWAVLYLHKGEGFDMFIIVALGFLAFHCIVCDLCLWGYFWYNDLHFAYDQMTGERIRIHTTPTRSKFIGIIWPTLSQFDVDRLKSTRRLTLPLHLLA